MIIVLIARTPDTAATIPPTMIGPMLDPTAAPMSPPCASRISDPRIEGMEMRNANSTANSLSRPESSPPTRVDPDLEIPGHIAERVRAPFPRIFNRILDEIRSNGTLAELSVKYFGTDLTQPQ